MTANAFIGKLKRPTSAELAAVLGTTHALWDELLAVLAKEFHLTAQEWGSYSPKAGWSLRLKHKQRTIVYLLPSRDAFSASFALGDRAIQAARASDLPRSVIRIINEAKRYAEGTAVRINVAEPDDIMVIKKLVAAKLAN